MIEIAPGIHLDENEISLDAIRASGPGGQNINKVSTAIQLRFDLRNSSSLSEEIKERLAKLSAGRLTDDGILIIEAKRFRTQADNRADAILRLTTLVQKALQPPKPRHATRPTVASQARRIQAKKRRGTVKRLRSNPLED